MDQTPPDRFEFLSIFTNYNCNYFCSYCCYHISTDHKRLLPKTKPISAEDFLRLNEIRDLLPAITLHVHGGEPIIYPEIGELLEHLDFPEIIVVSNLSLPLEKRLPQLAALKGKVRFVGSYHPEFVDTEIFLQNCDRLRADGMLERVSGVGKWITSDIVQMFKARGYDIVIYPYKGITDNVIYPENMREHARGWLTREPGCEMWCKSRKFLIDPQGNVWNCSTHMYQNNMQYCFGNIKTGFDLRPIFYKCQQYHYCNPCQGDYVEYKNPQEMNDGK